jgi:23S rRNA (adenine2503-C2)-methyltransferase
MNERIALYDLSLPELTEYMTKIGERPFRAKQIYRWFYVNGISDPAQMTDLPAQTKSKLAACAVTESLRPVRALRSEDGSTEKSLFETTDGHFIETVFMKYKDRNSVCISSQIGCRMGCTFCASGRDGLVRDLTPAEMSQQVILAERAAAAETKNIVIMGIGEPLDNYDNVKKFIENITDDHGRDMSMRAITLSTCGIVPMIARLAEDLPQVNLAVSLHAPNDKLREQIMPIAKRYRVVDVIAAAAKHYEVTHRRPTFEYALIEGFNDGPAHAKELAALLHGMNCLVNLIPLNSAGATDASRRGSTQKAAQRFREMLGTRHVPATVRRSLGEDIDAACGQLRLHQPHQSHQ